jgi:Protein of unknown function (DUF2844)
MKKLFVSAAALWLCISANAELGNRPLPLSGQSSMQVGAYVMPAPSASAKLSYTVSRTEHPGGTVVHEFINRSGTVFAVTWKGPFMPDLEALLGSHFAAMKGLAAKSPKAGNSALRSTGGDLVLYSGGRMQALEGYAYLTSLTPADFSTDALRQP